MLLLSVVVVPETTESGTGIRAWGGRAPLSALPGLPPGSASRSIRDLSAQAPSSSVVPQVVVPTCCLDECLNLRSEKAQPGIAVDGTLSVLQLAVADRLDDLVLSESELGASSLVAQGGALAPPLGFEAVDDSPLPRNGLGNGAARDDMASDAHAIRSEC